jgi:hypothetical protein
MMKIAAFIDQWLGIVGGAGAVAQALPRDFDRYFGANFVAKF